MPPEPFRSLSDVVPIRPLAAFVLSVADRALPGLSASPGAFAAAERALDDAWRWQRGEGIAGIDLYDRHADDLAALDIAAEGEAERDLASCIIHSFYYAMMLAFWRDSIAGHPTSFPPEDVCEVSDECIDLACEHAIRSSLCDRAWIEALRDRVASDFRSGDPGSLGPVVPRDYSARIDIPSSRHGR